VLMFFLRDRGGILSRSEAQSARNAKLWPQPIPYLLPIPLPLCDMVSRDLPSPPTVGSEGRFYSMITCLARDRRSLEFYLPAKRPTSKFGYG
jgi:hypothetical protein